MGGVNYFVFVNFSYGTFLILQLQLQTEPTERIFSFYDKDRCLQYLILNQINVYFHRLDMISTDCVRFFFFQY
ncbi:hypothetical protein C8R11_1262 [Nitrosomonas aestuarii]|nr:hypothetical protein C8R11_1262 [Nitrosomonas aestuarii]